MAANMELSSKLIGNVMAALHPILCTVRSDGTPSRSENEVTRLQKEWDLNAQEKGVLEKIIKAGERGDKTAVSKLLSQINVEAQDASSVGVSVKLLSETVRGVVEQSEDASAVGSSASKLSTEDRYTRIIMGTVAGFAAGTAAAGGNPIGGVIGGIGVGLVTAWATGE